MRFPLNILFPVCCAVMSLTACSGNNVDKNIDAAENALANNDFTNAQKICNTIAEKDSLNDLTTSQLCKLSILFMELADMADEDSNVGMAVNCYHRALELHPDSALNFYQSLPADRISLANMLWVLDRSLDTVRDTIGEFVYMLESDSINLSDFDRQYIENLKKQSN